MLEKIKPLGVLSLDIFSAVGTWAIVAISACYLMLNSARYDISSVIVAACLQIGFLFGSIQLFCDLNHHLVHLVTYYYALTKSYVERPTLVSALMANLPILLE